MCDISQSLANLQIVVELQCYVQRGLSLVVLFLRICSEFKQGRDRFNVAVVSGCVKQGVTLFSSDYFIDVGLISR
jgi:hypothetical protein